MAKKSRSRLVTFILLVAIVVGVVLAIVLVSVFTGRNTSALAKTMNDVTTTGYLSSSYENNSTVDKLLTNTSSKVSALDSEDAVKIENYQNVLNAYQTMGSFFAREIVYTSYTDVYGKNYSTIKSDLNKAQKNVDAAASYINEKWETIGDSVDALHFLWLDCEDEIDLIMSCTQDAMERLMEVYASCVNSTLLNNDFSSVIFEFCKIEMDNVSNAENGAGAQLLSIANTYLTISGENSIIEYPYNATLQTRIADLKENGKESTYYTQFKNGTLV